MTGRDDVEVLDHSRVRWRPGRLTQVGIAAMFIALVVGVVVDRRAEANERAALDQCSTALEASVVSALAPVRAMANYVRPTRDGSGPPLSLELDAMVSDEATAVLPRLADAAAVCESVQIWPHHRSSAARKQECLDRLARADDYLAEISRDGATYFQSTENLQASPPC